MRKGRLLASVCALGLIVVVPAFAAGTDNSSSSSPSAATGAATSNPSATSQPGAAAPSATQNNPASASEASTAQTHPSRRAMHRRRRAERQAMRRSGRGGETSQNADVDRLNDQSLEAARRGEPFMGGSSSAPAEGTGGPGTYSAPPPGNTKM